MTVELRLAEKCVRGEPTEEDLGDRTISVTIRAGTNVPGAQDKSRTRIEMAGVDLADAAMVGDPFPWNLTVDKNVFRIDVRGEAAAEVFQKVLQWAASEIGRQRARNKKLLRVEVP